jgi:outer membrane protein assembly factor BamB
MNAFCNTVLTGVVCLVLAGSAGAVSNKNRIAAPNTEPLVSHTLIQESGWRYNWQISLPLKKGETIERLNVFGSNLFAITSSNVLFCVDRQSGRVRSLTQIGTPGLPVSSPTYYEGHVGYVVGNAVKVFDPRSGTIIFERAFPQIGSSKGGLTRNSKYLYVAGSDNRLHVINVDGYWQQFEASAQNDAPIVSVVATENIVVFATLAGNVVGMSADAPRRLWQFDATGDIQGQVRLDGDAVYFGSEDSKLYKLNLGTGKLMWSSPFHSGGPIRSSLTVGSELVYVYNDLNGMYGVHKETGKAAWQAPSGRQMVCETPSRSFVFADAGVIKVMDNAAGRELYSVNFANVSRTAQNTDSPVMFLGDATGRVMSITVN